MTSSPTRGYLIDESGLGGIIIAVRGGVVPIAAADTESAAVRRAVEDLVRDLRSVTGAAPVVQGDRTAEARIVVGTLGTSFFVDEAVAKGRLDVSELHDDTGRLRWEGFLITEVDGALFLVGADRRGTVYAIYEFAEAIGVSPWYWWGNVSPTPQDRIAVVEGARHADWPSVQYRGVFLNDEEELFHWARTHTSDGTIGPETYVRVFELILRLKGNYLWPAMHIGAFNHDPENGRLANEMGIVIGASHCDMLLRSNEHEFAPWVAQQSEPVRYDYSIPGRNRTKLLEYWRGSVQQNRDYEVTWTVGMRGVHDTGFVTAAIDQDAALSDEEKFQERIRLLETVIADQRALLGNELAGSPESIPQLFIPYKEVLPLYDAGMRVPEDVTVVWANDNFGHIRRFPNGRELQRPGGHGLYYHSSYWSNMTMSYLATSSTPLALMKSELGKAWDRGIRKLWVDNIGGLKPLEIETEFFLRSAWEAGKDDRTADVESFVADWVDATFPGSHGDEAAGIYIVYYQLNNQRKLEHLTADTFAQTGYGDEAGQRLTVWRDLYDRTNRILDALPAAARDAFFQLFAVKIHLGYLVNAQFVYADRSTLAHQQGKLAAADHYLQMSRSFDDQKRALINFYNHTMSGGQWAGMFTPEQFPPPVMALHPAATPALTISGRGIGAIAWGQRAHDAAAHLTFYPHGVTDKWVEVFSTGAGAVSFTIEADPWLEVEEKAGTVTTERRIMVRLPDALACAGRRGTILISSPDTGETITVPVTVADAPALPAGFSGVVEADQYVSIDLSRPDEFTVAADNRWVVVPYLGRYGNAAVQAHGRGAGTDWDRSSTLMYRMYLRTAGTHVLELHRLPTLNATGTIRTAISIDDRAPVVVSSPITDELRGAWQHAVQDNIERLRLRLPYLEAGEHVVRLHLVDPDLTMSKLVVYTTTPHPVTNLGPDFSTHTTRPVPRGRVPHPECPGLDEVIRVATALYRTDPATVALPDQVYAGPGYWDGDTTFRRNLTVPQRSLGDPKYTAGPDGRKDVIAQLGSGAALEDDGRIALEAEWVLAGDRDAWTSPSDGPRPHRWTHTQAETDGRTGLAMHVRPRGLSWQDPQTAPGLHFAVTVATPGRYHVWMLVKYNDLTDDSCVLALDGNIQPAQEQFNGGSMCTYGTRQVWLWALVSDLDITAGSHVLSVLARKSGLRLDRLYLTTGDELPPADAAWQPSRRTSHAFAAATVGAAGQPL